MLCLFLAFQTSLQCLSHHNTNISVSCELCHRHRGWRAARYSHHCSYRSTVVNAAGQAWSHGSPPPRSWCFHLCHQDVPQHLHPNVVKKVSALCGTTGGYGDLKVPPTVWLKWYSSLRKMFLLRTTGQCHHWPTQAWGPTFSSISSH